MRHSLEHPAEKLPSKNELRKMLSKILRKRKATS